MSFLVRNVACSSCIYRPDSPLDLEYLEGEVRDPYVGFKGMRICHDPPGSRPVCCRGFWVRHAGEFPAGQIAQRMGWVEEVEACD